MHLNIVKEEKNGFVNDLKTQDKVRVDDTSYLKKEMKLLE